jgi:hypothetical protein
MLDGVESRGASHRVERERSGFAVAISDRDQQRAAIGHQLAIFDVFQNDRARLA